MSFAGYGLRATGYGQSKKHTCGADSSLLPRPQAPGPAPDAAGRA